MITVACVFWGNKFSLDYVKNLKAMIGRNTTIKHNFVCFSDRVIENIETKLLKPGYTGWWNKLQLFDSRYQIKNRIVYFDLDTLITGNLDWLLQYDGPFMGIEDLGSSNSHQRHLKGVLQTGVMAFNPNQYDWIWLDFMLDKKNVTTRYRGDGEYLNDKITNRKLLQDLFPNKIKSYKYHVYPNTIDNASIICFHGRPSIIQAMNETVTTPMATYYPQQWIKDFWKND